MVYIQDRSNGVNFGKDQKKSGKILPFREQWGLLVKAEAAELNNFPQEFCCTD